MISEGLYFQCFGHVPSISWLSRVLRYRVRYITWPSLWSKGQDTRVASGSSDGVSFSRVP